eukprot:scaffold10084_cov139-Isochrysis_galbana.AAC.14
MGVLLGRCFRGCAECRKILVQVPSPAPVGLRRHPSQGPHTVYRLIWVKQGALGPLCRAGRSPGAERGTADLRAALAMGKLMSTWAPTRLWRLLYEPPSAQKPSMRTRGPASGLYRLSAG